MSDNIDDNLHPHEDYRYTYSFASEGEEVQWQLMADDGVITHEEAERHVAIDAQFAKANLARRRPSLMSEVNRMKFMRTLTLHGWTQADLVTAVSRSKHSFAQRLIDCAAASAS